MAPDAWLPVWTFDPAQRTGLLPSRALCCAYDTGPVENILISWSSCRMTCDRKPSLDTNGSARAVGVTLPGSLPSAWPRSGARADAQSRGFCGPAVSLDLTFVLRKVQRDTSCNALRSHLQRRAAGAGTDERLVLDIERVASAWGPVGGEKTAARAPRDTSAAPACARPTSRPASLARSRDALYFKDDSAQKIQDGPYSVATKDGLTSVRRDNSEPGPMGPAIQLHMTPRTCARGYRPGPRRSRRTNRRGECPRKNSGSKCGPL